MPGVKLKPVSADSYEETTHEWDLFGFAGMGRAFLLLVQNSVSVNIPEYFC